MALDGANWSIISFLLVGFFVKSLQLNNKQFLILNNKKFESLHL